MAKAAIIGILIAFGSWSAVARGSSAAGAGTTNNAPGLAVEAAKDQLWSLKPVTRAKVPAVPGRKWKPRNPIDNFIAAKLAEAALAPSPEASRRILIRRLSFDLVGLPPTPEEVRDFERDNSADAYEKVVERLLASPQYGERWAQHWLDVVRFAETHGFEMNQPRPNAWRYRDYVIGAFNEDKPYDRFIMEQLAGDAFGVDAATGFLVAGARDEVKSPDPVLTAAQRADELHDMVSTTGSAFLGLTIGCARCHNHKFDPIPQVDYYAMKACLAGVQHGERKLQTPDLPAREAEAEQCRRKLAATEATLTQFEPIASTGRLLLFEAEPAFGSSVIQQLRKAAMLKYSPGTARGERDDPGDLARLPTSTRGFLAWTNFADTDVFAWQPGVEGRFHVRLSWACGSDTHAKDARFLLDRDGDLSTTDDQAEIARVDQQRFADGTGDPGNKRLWSGFYDAGVFDLASSNKIVLRGGATPAVVTAGMLGLAEGPPPSPSAAATDDPDPVRARHSVRAASGDPGQAVPLPPPALPPPVNSSLPSFPSVQFPASAASASPTPAPAAGDRFLRAPVSARRNVERFAPVEARRLRFTITRTSDAEPCIDELEVYTAEASPTNIALAITGTKARASSVFPNSELHRLEHINDGKFGNSRSWISDERGKGWVELEFPKSVTIDCVIWGRDREQKYSDRLPLDYRVEVAAGSNDWRLVASSQDRVPYNAGRTSAPVISVPGLSAADTVKVTSLLEQRAGLEARIKELTTFPMAYAGVLTEKPEPTHRLQRGDPMQKREVVGPGVLSAIPVKFDFGSEAADDDQHRRLALARWIADPANPLPARVMVNRLWQHHFGEGLVGTPSDFGRKGTPPSHPELLDWLAAEFVSPTTRAGRLEPAPSPWSIKHLHRLIVNSAAYRQVSASRPDGMVADAGDRLLWRFPPQRLEAEPLRDAILSVSGRLDLRLGGPGYSAFEPNDNYVRVYNGKKDFGPPEWRRMVYMSKVRMQQDTTFGAFDCPDGGQIAPKRMRSTTPLQALNLLNSNFLVQQAGLFAERLEREAGKNPDADVRLAFELALNRLPEAQETRAARSLIDQHGLAIFCRALLNSNEFIFLE